MRIISLILFIFIVFIALPIAILRLRDRLLKKKRSPETVEGEQAERRTRLMNPDFPAMERFLGAPIPQQIVDMYRMDIIHNTDIELTNPNDPENPWTLSAFIPAHPADYDHMWDEARDKFCFAESPCGDPYYVDPKMSELPVYIYYHDGDDHEKVADSLSEFLSWIPRKAAS